MSGNPQDLGSSPDPVSSKLFTWSPTRIRPAPPGEWAADANVPQASWGPEGESDSEMEAEPHTTPKARRSLAPMQVQTASCTLTNPLGRSQASSPTPVPTSRTASRIGKKSCPAHPSSTNLAAAGGAAVAALFPDKIRPQQSTQQRPGPQPNNINNIPTSPTTSSPMGGATL